MNTSESFQSNTASHRALNIGLVLILIAFAISVVGYVAYFGTNVPIADDWNLLETVLQFRTSGLSLGALIGFHNEHRIVLTRVLSGVGLALTNGDVKSILYLNSSFIVATLVIICLIVRRLNASPSKVLIACFTIASFVTGWFQWQNLLWAFQVPWFFLPFSLVACVWTISSVRTNHYCFIFSATLLVLALSAMANGIVVWIAIIPAILIRIKHWPTLSKTKFIGLYCTLVVGVVIIYFSGLPKSSQLPPVGDVIEASLRFCHFFFSLLGSPFSAAASILGPEREIGLLSGLIGFTYTGVLVIAILRSDIEEKGNSLLSLGFGCLLFSSISLVLIAYGRYKMFSPNQIESRYSTFALYFYVGAILLTMALPTWPPQSARSKRYQQALLYVFCAVCLFGIFQKYSLFALHGANIRSASLRIKEALNLSLSFPDQKELANGLHTFGKPQLATLMKNLERRHLWVPRRLKDFQKTSLETIESAGNVDQVMRNDEDFTLSGWARLPEGRPPDRVIAFSCVGDLACEPLALSEWERLQRPDVSAALNDSGLLNSGWRIHINRALTPNSLILVGYDLERSRFYSIPFDQGRLKW